jgi:hypothetical protein
MSTLTNEARIILEAAALALEINYPDIAAVREMLKQADALLEQQLSYAPSHRDESDDGS